PRVPLTLGYRYTTETEPPQPPIQEPPLVVGQSVARARDGDGRGVWAIERGERPGGRGVIDRRVVGAIHKQDGKRRRDVLIARRRRHPVDADEAEDARRAQRRLQAHEAALGVAADDDRPPSLELPPYHGDNLLARRTERPRGRRRAFVFVVQPGAPAAAPRPRARQDDAQRPQRAARPPSIPSRRVGAREAVAPVEVDQRRRAARGTDNNALGAARVERHAGEPGDVAALGAQAARRRRGRGGTRLHHAIRKLVAAHGARAGDELAKRAVAAGEVDNVAGCRDAAARHLKKGGAVVELAGRERRPAHRRPDLLQRDCLCGFGRVFSLHPSCWPVPSPQHSRLGYTTST
ncbi:unnamed protein product, partial [Pelagomonas calceolata]